MNPVSDAAIDLPVDTAHIWLWRGRHVDCEPLDDRSLSARERGRAARFHFSADRNRYVAGRVMLRDLCSRYVGGSPDAWVLERDAYGRPDFADRLSGNAPDLWFNISHTAGAVGCVFARRPEVGLDIEAADVDRRNLDGVAAKALTPAETEWLARQPRDAAGRKRALLDLWTLKEAYAKARGLGLALPLDGFSVLPEGGHGARLVDDSAPSGGAANWRFYREAWRAEAGGARLLACVLASSTPDVRFVVRDYAPGA